MFKVNKLLDFKYLKHMARRGASYIHPRGYTATRQLIEELGLAKGMRVLEFGCGTGATIADIISSYDVSIDGVDVMDEMINAANERLKYLKLSEKVNLFKVTPGKKLPFDANTFDRAYTESVMGFQDLQNLKFILAEIHRVLKTGGIFAVNEALWKENVTDETVKEIYESSEKDFGLSQASSANINIKTLITVCEKTGFAMLKLVNLDDENDMIVADNSNNISREYNIKKKRKSILNLGFIINELNYRRKLKKHKNDGSFINSWLLKLKKI